MSLDLCIPVRTAPAITVRRVNQHIHAAGIGLVMDDTNLTTHNGLWPGSLRGQATGVEFSLDTAAGEPLLLSTRFATWPWLAALNFSWGRAEPVAAYAIAASMAEMEGAEVYDPQADAWMAPQKAYNQARQFDSVLFRLLMAPFSWR